MQLQWEMGTFSPPFYMETPRFWNGTISHLILYMVLSRKAKFGNLTTILHTFLISTCTNKP